MLQPPDVPPLPETWTRRELPILRAALQRADAGEPYISLAAIQNEVGLDSNQMRAGLDALESAFPPYMTTQLLFGESPVEGHVIGISERARRILGTWPSSDAVVDRMVAAIEALAEKESDPEKKSKLKMVAAFLGGMAREVAVGVISQVLGTTL